MKTYFLLFTIFVAVIGCQQAEDISESGINDSTLFKNDHSNDEIDGFVKLEIDEYIDDNIEQSGAVFVGIFKDIGKRIEAGTVLINNELELDKTSDKRLLYYPDVNHHDFYGKQVGVSFKTATNLLNDFDDSFYMPSQANIKSNIGKGEFFKKSQDLHLNWTADTNIDHVYLAICSDGVACITKQLPNTGNAIISKKEFVSFNEGAKVVIHVAIGSYNCRINKRKNICIGGLVNARTAGHTVQ